MNVLLVTRSRVDLVHHAVRDTTDHQSVQLTAAAQFVHLAKTPMQARHLALQQPQLLMVMAVVEPTLG